MVDKIYDIKNKLIEQVDQQMRERPDRVDSEMIDAIKDMAEAEKSCWEAEYYRTVTEAMEGGTSGYSGGSDGSAGGSSRGGSGGSSGWQNQYGSGRNSGGRRGYDGTSRTMGYQEAMDTMRHYMHNSDPVERERMRNEMMSM